MLWLWRRPAATALIGPLAWEPPYARSEALEKTKKKKKKKKKTNTIKKYYKKENKTKQKKTTTKKNPRSTHQGAEETNPTRNHEEAGSIPGLGTSPCHGCGQK